MFTSIANFLAKWNLVQRFNMTGFLIMILGTAVIGRWVSERIKASIINESAATTALYLDSFVTPNLQDLDRSDSLTLEQFETLSDLLQGTDLGRQIAAIKVWDKNGQILYSNSPSMIGRVFPGAEDLETAWDGRVVAKISNLDEDENVEEKRLYTKLLEIYIPVRLNGTHKVIAVAEFYQKVDALEAEIASAQRQSWLAVSTGMGLVYLWLVGFFRWTRNRLWQQEVALKNQVAQLNEVLSQNAELDRRVRRATANAATLNERLLRRISAEIIDGPAQEIGLAMLHLNHAISENQVCRAINRNSKCNENLPIVHISLQAALQEMQIIATGLGLPQLDGVSLAEVLTSAVQTHELRTRTTVAFQLMDKLPDQVPMPIKITAYRIVQEALNNAYRHAGGIGQAVQVSFKTNGLQIEVSDQGPGFDITQPVIGNEHIGLAGMRERVESLGGIFSVESQIEHGTKINVCLFLQSTQPITKEQHHANGSEIV